MWPPRSFWTPRYLLGRVSVAIYERTHPDHPWLTRHANRIVASLLQPTDVGLEWGSGRRTIWFARRVAQLTSVEDDPTWYERQHRTMKEVGITNVTYVLAEHEVETYADIVDRFSDGSIDFALVDGSFRSVCANRVVPKLRPGGFLIIDDVHRFLPSESTSPRSRSLTMGPRAAAEWERRPGLGWADFLARVTGWRRIWTTDGVSDTAIWLRHSP